MEIKKDKKVIITGKNICFVAGILSLIVGVYWLIRALFYDDTNLIAMLSSMCIALYLGRRHITVSARGLLLTESGATAPTTKDGDGVRTRSG